MIEQRPDPTLAATATGRAPRFGEILVRLRSARALSGRALARKARIAESAVSHYEKGRLVPRAKALASLARALDVPLELLLWFAYARRSTRSPRWEVVRAVDKLMLAELELCEGIAQPAPKSGVRQSCETGQDSA